MTTQPVSAPPTTSAATTRARTIDLSVDQIDPDPQNRLVAEDTEAFQSLADSIAMFGVLQRLHVRPAGERYLLIDGERRWRAAKRAGRSTVPCEVWPATTSTSDLVAAGVVLNEQRAAHSLIHMARRLRQLKNSEGLTIEQVAKRVAISFERAKNYLLLFEASDHLIQFLDESDVPLRIAVEMVRYERATNEARSRALLRRFREEPLSREQLVELRRRDTTKPASATHPDAPKPPSYARGLERALRSELEVTLERLNQLLRSRGYCVHRLDAADGNGG